jgi:glutamate/tyrosine decarboxylase-like PLP-dependent enzyme
VKPGKVNGFLRYQVMLERQIRQGFPAASARGMSHLMDSLSAIRPVLEGIDFNSPSFSGIKASEFKFPGRGMSDPQEVIDHIIGLFNGLPNWAHPLTQKNLMPPTTSVSVVTAFLTALFNPDICSPEFSGRLIEEAEKKAVSVLSRIVGYDPRVSYGFFTYGGTFGIERGIRLSLDKVFPYRAKTGHMEGVKIVSSESAHFSVKSAAEDLGLGSDNVIRIRSNKEGEMSILDLEDKCREMLNHGEKIACIVATIGTTDTFGLDNIAGISRLRDDLASKYHLNYPISIHADAAVAWAWGFFRDYDFKANPLQFPAETLKALRKITRKLDSLGLADTIDVNPHKYGYVPIPSSFLLFKENGATLAPLKRSPEEMPQLHNVGPKHPGAYTMETTRYAGGVLGTLANLMFFGREGYQAMLGRIVEMGIRFRKKLSYIKGIRVINRRGVGGGTIFYFRTPGKTVAEQNNLNQRIYDSLNGNEGDQAINLSTSFTRDGVLVLKSLIMSPFVSSEDIDKACDLIVRAVRQANG